MAESVRIDPSTHAALSEIARAKHIPVTEALSNAVELYRREVFVEAVSAGYSELRNNPEAWSEEHDERQIWDKTSADGLENE